MKRTALLILMLFATTSRGMAMKHTRNVSVNFDQLNTKELVQQKLSPKKCINLDWTYLQQEELLSSKNALSDFLATELININPHDFLDKDYDFFECYKNTDAYNFLRIKLQSCINRHPILYEQKIKTKSIKESLMLLHTQKLLDGNKSIDPQNLSIEAAKKCRKDFDRAHYLLHQLQEK